MFEFTNLVYWAGAAAISSPIIIHLINRLRYRRIRWAAMEFLLKSQQRNRRKLIIEQLILLALRCLLVMLVVAMLVRPRWLLGDNAYRNVDRPDYHFILIDDSLSMQDRAAPDGAEKQAAFAEATRLVGEMSKKALESNHRHYFTVMKLSEVLKPEDRRRPELGRSHHEINQLIGQGQLAENEPPGQLLTSDEAQILRNKLDSLQCSYLRLSLREGIGEAAKYLQIHGSDDYNKYLHVVSDFRRRDWLESDADQLCQLVGRLAHPKGGNVQVRLHDVANPNRTTDRQQVLQVHPNLGLTALSADSRVTVPNARVRLKATLRNFSDTEEKSVRLVVKVDGQERIEFDQRVERIASGEEKTVDFDLTFDFSQEEEMARVARLLRKISIHVDHKDHLPADNDRHTYIELRREIPVLLVDPDSTPIGSDNYFVNLALTSSPKTGLKCERIRPSDLTGKKDLEAFPVIFLLNVAGVGTTNADIPPEGLKALESYVNKGGSVVFFLGPRVNPESYNTDLYKSGQGIFPAPLVMAPDPGKPNVPYVDEPFLTEDINPSDNTEVIYPIVKLLQADHPVFKIYEDRTGFLYFLTINRYFKVDPTWVPGENAKKLAQVRNHVPLTTFRGTALTLVGELNRDQSAFATKLKDHALKIQAAVQGAETRGSRKGLLLHALEAVQGDEALAEYFKTSGQDLKKKIDDLHRAVDMGDPVVLEAAIGKGKAKGHVLVFLTPAAPTSIPNKEYGWNNWAIQFDPSGLVPYVVMMLQMHKHMAELRAANQTELEVKLETDLEVRLDKYRYDPQLLLWPWPDPDPKEGEVREIKPIEEVKTFREDGDDIVAKVKAPYAPGHYQMQLNPPPSTKGETEMRPLAFNLDNRAEGDLARLGSTQLDERLMAALTKVTDLNLDTEKSREFVQSREWFVADQLANPLTETPPKTWSEYWWVLFLFIGLLLVEQLLAMLFSHHLKGGEAALPAQAVRSGAAPIPVVVPTPQEVEAAR